MKQFLRPFSKRYATHYFCCSELAGRWLFGNKTYDQGKVYLLNNAIDVDKFKYDEKIRKEKRKELNIKDNQLVIGHIGRFVQQKNHEFLIDIFNEIYKQDKNAILLLIGEGPLKEEIQNKVNELGLDKNVKFLGQRSDANELYQAMDLFLFPSLYEGLGMVLIEAQCAGLPCIASIEVPQIAKISDKFVFENLKENPKKWADICLKFLKEKSIRKNSEKSLNIQNYNIKNEAKKLKNKYNDLLRRDECK